MREIPLTQGKVALVDDEDYERVSRFKWTAFKGRRQRSRSKRIIERERWYAVRRETTPEGQRMVAMHRFILGAKRGAEVDHADTNGLNNRRKNIRLCTRAQNCANQRKLKFYKGRRPTSRYKGVTWNKRSGKWCAQIGYNYKHYHLGLFISEMEAAQAYAERAKQLFGRFARAFDA